MSSKNMQGKGKPLTVDLVFTKTKSDSLHNIKNLNLWGNDLQDLSLIEQMPNLEVVSLSVNRISSLKDFGSCHKLQELYLRKNNISDLKEIKYLLRLPLLKVLWLHDNPCSLIKNYREIVIKYLPKLQKLDNSPVTPEQRAQSQKVVYSLGSQEENYKSQASHHQQSYEEQYREEDRRQQQRPSSSSNTYQQPQPTKKPEPAYYEQKPAPVLNYPSYQEQKPSHKGRKQPQYSQQQQQQEYVAAERDMDRNQNILMAILSLMRELDAGSLEIVRREASKMLQ